MADVGRALGMENAPVSAPVVDISGEVPVEALQTLKEPGGQTSLVMAVADDSVFYGEDEEIPQAASDSSAFMHVGADRPEGHESVYPVRDLGAEESEPTVYDGIGITKEGPVCHSASSQASMDNSIGNKMSHVSSPVAIQAAESASESGANCSVSHSDELLAVQQAKSPASEAAQLHVGKQMETSLLVHTLTAAPTKPQSEQAGGTEERGKSSDAHEEVGEVTRLTHGSSEDDLGVYSVCDSNGVRARLNISFNHLTHEKYGTVSYRQIRRGHTRQRIEEFESRTQL